MLNLKESLGVEALLRRTGRIDALIDGMRPGVMERLGLGPDVCLQRKPSLVYGRMTCWGEAGPWAQRAGHINNYTAPQVLCSLPAHPELSARSTYHAPAGVLQSASAPRFFGHNHYPGRRCATGCPQRSLLDSRGFFPLNCASYKPSELPIDHELDCT